MSKTIIENRSSQDDLTAISAVMYVMRKGRISNNGKQYCYAVRFSDGLMVVSDLNKRSDRFVVVDDKHGDSDEK